MRVTSKGQVTIPQAIREKFQLFPHTSITFVAEGDRVYIVKSQDRDTHGRGDSLVSRMRGTATIRMTTEEILGLTRGEA